MVELPVANWVAFLLLICGLLQMVALNLPTLALIHVKVIPLPSKMLSWTQPPARRIGFDYGSDERRQYQYEDTNLYADFDLNIDAFKVCHPISKICGSELHFRFHYRCQISLIITIEL